MERRKRKMAYNKYGLAYQGGKSVLADDLLSVIPSAENFYDLFAGGCSITHAAILSDKWENVYSNDISDMPLVFKKAVEGFDYNSYLRPVSKEEFNTTSDPIIKYIFSFSTNFKDYALTEKNREIFELFLRFVKNPIENIKLLNYYNGKPVTSYTIVLRQIRHLIHRFNCIDSAKLNITKLDYRAVNIKPNSVIYCDIPYINTGGYGVKFNHQEFYEWVKDKAKEGIEVYFSECSAPSEFTEVWSKDVRFQSTLNGNKGSKNTRTEKLFKYVI